ncbi:YdcF family protein [Paenibacillus sp. SC116]|uniref:YdcF family protein n=1 Tax=Paenibacillus sp. SC116 TaxID=2968986 RepID=UPI00215A9B02|nr:YdcF family protein [Paenibacillus sp. SC116]MCR8842840.1 YdcF family protein [Paenibacillus sp. SC116]
MKSRHSSNRPNLWRKTFKRMMILLATFLLVGCVWFGYTQYKIAQAGGESTGEKTDVGIVLGASMWGANPSPGLRERLDLAVKLYQEGRFEYILVTGGKGGSQDMYSEAEGSKRYLVEQGIPEERVLEEDQSTSTLENLLYSKTILSNNQWDSITIITHDFHGTRAREIAESLQYAAIEVETVQSKVLSPIWHPLRESLAYTKWKWDRLWL